MKMKEVLSQTGLTDRAVRLYVAQELVFPSGTVNYNGRRCLDFSEQDVRRLCHIAQLRRADFSIAEIRQMLSDASSIPSVLRAYIEREETDVRHKSEILQTLRTLPQTGGLTVEDVCAHLADASECPVPETDLCANRFALLERRSYRRFGTGLLLAAFAALLLIPLFWHIRYRYLAASDGYITGVLLLYHGWVRLAVIGAVLVILNLRRSKQTKRKTKASEFLVLFCVSTAWLTLLVTFVSYELFAPFFYSQTDDPHDYCFLDRAVVRHYMPNTLPDGLFGAVFPDRIPDEAHLPEAAFPQAYPASTRYHYYYLDCWDAQIDIAAQWTLPENAYQTAKSDVTAVPVQTVQNGNWTCLYFADREQTAEDGYTFLIFAYNDTTHTVRYLFSYAERADACEPYYLQLDW